MDAFVKDLNTANPKNGKRWEHKELEAVLKKPNITRVKEGGLYGVVRRSVDGIPSVMFRWRFRFDKKLSDFTAGTWPGDSLKSIRESHDWAAQQLKAGKNPTTERNLLKLAAATQQSEQVRVHKEETVRALALRWQTAELTKRGEKGRKDNGDEVIRSFDLDVFPSIGSHPINAIHKSVWVNLFDDVKERAPRMAARLFADLSQFLDWCERREYIEASPLHRLRKSDIASPYKERDRFLWNPDSSKPEAELLELRDKLPSAGLQRKTELAIWLMLATGCRVGEISKSAWSHVDFDSREWVFPKDNTKNGTEHRVYLSDFSVRHIRELYQITGKTPWCFPADGKKRGEVEIATEVNHVDEKTISKQVHDRQRPTPLKNRSKATNTLVLSGGNWTSHDVRRTAARIMAEMGATTDTVEACINHKMEKLKRTYQKAVPWESKREAWEKLGDYLDVVLAKDHICVD